MNRTKIWLAAAMLLIAIPATTSAQVDATYNTINGQLTLNTSSGFNLVSVKIPGPQAISIDRWLDGTSQDTVPFWVQQFTTNTNNGVTAEQWAALSIGGAGSPTSAVPPGIYQIATYAPGLTIAAFPGDADSGIAAGSLEIGGLIEGSPFGTVTSPTLMFVPEPTSHVLLTSTFLAALILLRRKRKN